MDVFILVNTLGLASQPMKIESMLDESILFKIVTSSTRLMYLIRLSGIWPTG